MELYINCPKMTEIIAHLHERAAPDLWNPLPHDFKNKFYCRHFFNANIKHFILLELLTFYFMCYSCQPRL